MNAINLEYFAELGSVFRAVKRDRDVRCVVLKSEFPKVFTAGLDLKNPPMMPGTGSYTHNGEEYSDPARDALKFMNDLEVLQSAVSAIEDCDKPVIVCVSGLCIGAGVDVITACDIRLCSSDAVFSVREVDIGIAADVGTLQRLPKVVGNQGWVREVCFTGRDFGSQEALDVGLIYKVYTSYEVMLEQALVLAQQIAAKPPLATLSTKHILNHARDHSVLEGLGYVKVWNSVMLNSRDTVQATMNALQRKKGVYPKL